MEALNELAWAVRKTDPQRSLELAVEARERAREYSYEIGLGWALRNSGHAHYRLADYSVALTESLEALEIFERLGLDDGRLSASGGVGNAYTRLSDYAQGLRFHRESLRIRREMGDPAGEGASLNNLGVIHFELADYPVALQHYLASLEIWERLKHRDGVGNAFNNLGQVHEKMGDLDRALECYDQSLQSFEEVSNGVGACATRVNRARVLLVLCSQSLFRFADLGDDGLCRGDPDKGCGVIVSAIDVVVDRLDWLVHAGDGEALELTSREFAEEALDEIEPRG